MHRLIKIILPAILALVASGILYVFELQTINDYIFILSAIIQIIMFIVWFFEDSSQTKILENTLEHTEKLDETKKSIEEIREYQNKKEGLLEKKQKILVNLIKEGAVPSLEINKIIKSKRRKGMFVISTLGGKEFKLKKVLTFMGEDKPVSIIPKILYDLQFKRVYFTENVFIILKEDLPPKLRKSDMLKKIIYNELLNKWKSLQKAVIESNLKGYDKWKEGSGFNCNLFIIDIEEGEIGILYKRLTESEKYSDYFSEEFKSLLMSHADRTKIGQIVKDKVKANQILKKLTIGLLLSNLPEEVKKGLLKKEPELMKGLNIKNFIDISNVTKGQLEKVLIGYVPKDKLTESVNQIMKEIKDYVQITRELNLF